MSTIGIIIDYTGLGCQSPNPQKIQCFKWEFRVRFARLFQERNPGVKRDLPVIFEPLSLPMMDYAYIVCTSAARFNA